MSWYKQSRAINEELNQQLPAELYVVHDGENVVAYTWDREDARDEVLEHGGHAEYATYVRAGVGSEGKGSSNAYHNSFPESLYPVIDASTGESIGSQTAYSQANSLAVETGEDAVFTKYVRHDRVTMRSWTDAEREAHPHRTDELGYMNISGDRYEAYERMAADALRAHTEGKP